MPRLTPLGLSSRNVGDQRVVDISTTLSSPIVQALAGSVAGQIDTGIRTLSPLGLNTKSRTFANKGVSEALVNLVGAEAQAIAEQLDGATTDITVDDEGLVGTGEEIGHLAEMIPHVAHVRIEGAIRGITMFGQVVTGRSSRAEINFIAVSGATKKTIITGATKGMSIIGRAEDTSVT